MGARLEMDYGPMLKSLGQAQVEIAHWEKPLQRFGDWLAADIKKEQQGHTFASDYHRATTFRGAIWPGTRSPERKGRRSKFKFSGRSGHDVVGFDTGKMMGQFLSRSGGHAGVLSANKRSISLIATVSYAKWFNRRRHIDQVGPKDGRVLHDYTAEHIVQSLKQARLA